MITVEQYITYWTSLFKKKYDISEDKAKRLFGETMCKCSLENEITKTADFIMNSQKYLIGE